MAKRLGMLMLATLLLVSFAACAGEPTDGSVDDATGKTSPTTVTTTTTAVITTTAAPQTICVTPSFMTGAGTEETHYSVYLPQSWSETCEWEKTEMDFTYSVTFYEKGSRADGSGGKLFTIIADSVGMGYADLPDYEEFGTLTVNGTVMWHLIVSYPTDVQFALDRYEIYQSMSNEIPTILSSLTAAEGYTFVKAD